MPINISQEGGVMSNDINETISERIIEALIEGDHSICVHDYKPKTNSYPGHHGVTYDIDDAGKAKVMEILGEMTIPKEFLQKFADELGKDIR